MTEIDSFIGFMLRLCHGYVILSRIFYGVPGRGRGRPIFRVFIRLSVRPSWMLPRRSRKEYTICNMHCVL